MSQRSFARVVVATLALAGDEGHGTLFPYAAGARVPSSRGFVNETWSQPHLQIAGAAAHESGLGRLLPSSDSGTPVMTAISPALRAMDGMAAFAGLRRRATVTATQVVVSYDRAPHVAYDAGVAPR